MPKTEPIKRDPWASWRGMVLEAKERLGLTYADLASRLRTRPQGSASRVSRQMVARWVVTPDIMPMWAFAAVNRILEIEAEEARRVAVVWR